MRIGLLTHHWVHNFGANLQALSTSRFLNRMGHEVWILNYRPPIKEHRYRQQVSPVQADTHQRFCDLYLPQSPICRSEEQLVEFCETADLDVVLVGSDVVLRLRHNDDREDRCFPNPYWLQWTRASLHPAPFTGSLAASGMGTNYFGFPVSVRRGIRDAVSDMDYVSVRDRWTQLMLAALTRGRCWPRLCPDPVFVLNDAMDMTYECTDEPEAQHKEYILLSVYQKMLSDAWVEEFVRIAHRNRFRVFSIPHPEGEVRVPVDRIISLPLPPLDWYTWIQHAAGFVGVRMHSVICSMVNGVPFLSFDVYRRGRFRLSSKSYDLCARAGVRSLCLSGQQRRRLHPENAFEMLRSERQDRVRDYIGRATGTFLRTVEEILVR